MSGGVKEWFRKISIITENGNTYILLSSIVKYFKLNKKQYWGKSLFTYH